MLQYLREPVQALIEMRRVLVPGGVIGIACWDLGTVVREPASALFDQLTALNVRSLQHEGDDPFAGRHLRRWLLEAGFVRAEAEASAISAGSPETLRRMAPLFKANLAGITRTALAQGWMDQATVDAIAAEIDAWAERPDAYWAAMNGTAIGWVDT